MSFVNPDFFILLLLPLLIMFWLLKSGSIALEKYFDAEIFKKMQRTNAALSSKSRAYLFILALVLIITALARPVSDERSIKIEAKGSDIVVALDISRSMLARDFYPNRLEWAKNKALKLLTLTKQNRVGVIAFANSSYIVSPLSFDKKAVSFLIDRLDTTSITEQGTNFKQMIDSSSLILEKAKEKFVILLTDGGDKNDFSDEIELAREAGITMFIIGTGTTKGMPVEVKAGEFIKDKNGKILISYMNENIKDLAIKTSGAYMNSVTSDADVKEVIRRIESSAHEQTLKEQEIKQYTELFYFPLAIAIFILLLAFSSLPRRSAVAILALMFITPDSKADILDFQKLQNAKNAYENKEYKKSAFLYHDFKNSEAAYNRANALYKNGKYSQAAKIYEKLDSKNRDLMYKKSHNLGNAYAKEGSKESLEKAIKAYTDALKINDDEQTKENLEAVKKALQKKKKQDKKDNKKKDDKKDSDKNKKSDENKDNKKDNKDKQSKDSDSKDKKKSEEDKNKDKDKKSKEQKEKNSKSKKDEEKKDAKKEQEKVKNRDDEKNKEEPKEAKQINQSDKKINPDEISDLEMKKWKKMLQKRGAKTRLYEMKSTQQPEGDINEKPW